MKYDLRLQMVRFADANGLKAAARHFGCQVKTVRKWHRRWTADGKARGSLQDRSRAPRTCPHKTSPSVESQILRARAEAPCYGPRRLKDYYGIPASRGAIARILRQNGLASRRKKKHERKRDMRAVKAGYRPFQENQADSKYLTDIPFYVAQLLDQSGLPRFQYTFRDVRTGGVFLGFGGELTQSHACCFIAAVGAHLARCGFPLKGRGVVQTDNGSEYSGAEQRDSKQHGYRHTVEHVLRATHRFIPPGKKNHQADVESFHAFVESEFFDLERFHSPDEFYDRASAWLLWWNTVRKNYSKGERTPDEILLEASPSRDPRVWMFPAMNLDKALALRVENKEKTEKRGYYVPELRYDQILWMDGRMKKSASFR